MSSFLELIRSFDAAHVDYVLVGGFATVIHGHQRLTGDVDFVIALDEANTLRAIDLLTSLGYRPRAPVDPRGFADPATRQSWVNEKGLLVMSFFNPSNAMLEVDLFVDYPIPKEKLWESSKLIDVSGVNVRVCSIDHLIEMKLAASRPKDLEDVRILRIIKESNG